MNSAFEVLQSFIGWHWCINFIENDLCLSSDKFDFFIVWFMAMKKPYTYRSNSDSSWCNWSILFGLLHHLYGLEITHTKHIRFNVITDEQQISDCSKRNYFGIIPSPSINMNDSMDFRTFILVQLTQLDSCNISPLFNFFCSIWSVPHDAFLVLLHLINVQLE